MYFKLQPFPSSLDPFGEICIFVFSARDPINQPIMFRELELDIEVDVDTFTVVEYSLLSFLVIETFSPLLLFLIQDFSKTLLRTMKMFLIL